MKYIFWFGLAANEACGAMQSRVHHENELQFNASWQSPTVSTWWVLLLLRQHHIFRTHVSRARSLESHAWFHHNAKWWWMVCAFLQKPKFICVALIHLNSFVCLFACAAIRRLRCRSIRILIYYYCCTVTTPAARQWRNKGNRHSNRWLSLFDRRSKPKSSWCTRHSFRFIEELFIELNATAPRVLFFYFRTSKARGRDI